MSTVMLPVDVAVALAFTAVQWADKRIFLLVIEHMTNECPTSLTDLDTRLRQGMRRVEHSEDWECQLFTIARNFDLVLFLPFLYWRIAEGYSAVSLQSGYEYKYWSNRHSGLPTAKGRTRSGCQSFYVARAATGMCKGKGSGVQVKSTGDVSVVGLREHTERGMRERGSMRLFPGQSRW